MSIATSIFGKLSEEDKKLSKALKNVLGFSPGYMHYYRVAFTHSSITDSMDSNNERLEYLGDAFIGSIVGEYLFKKYPAQGEGYLTEMRSKIVSRVALNEMAIKMGLPKLVRYNSSDKLLKRSHIFGNALEALVGAIYLDKGFEKTRKFILNRLLANYIDIEALEVTEYNYKNKIYTWAARNGHKLDFVTISERREGNRKVFTVGIEIDGELKIEANGWNKKEASQRAAAMALEMVETNNPEHIEE